MGKDCYKNADITYSERLKKFHIIETANEYDSSKNYSEWRRTTNTLYVDYCDLKKYKNEIVIILPTSFFENFANMPGGIKAFWDKDIKKILIDIYGDKYDFEYYAYRFDCEYLTIYYNTESDRVEIINSRYKPKKLYRNYINFSAIYENYLSIVEQNKKLNKCEHPSLEEIIHDGDCTCKKVVNEDTKNTEKEDVKVDTFDKAKDYDIDKFIDKLLNSDFDSEPEDDVEAEKVPEKKKEEIKEEKVPTIHAGHEAEAIDKNNTPKIMFDGTLMQNLAVFYTFYKIPSGEPYIPNKGDMFIYPRQQSKDVPWIHVKEYIEKLKVNDSVEVYGERLFKYIVSWMQFELSDTSMISKLLVSDTPFNIVIDENKIEGYQKLVENPELFNKATQYVDDKFGKHFDWRLDDNKIIHLSLSRNDFID